MTTATTTTSLSTRALLVDVDVHKWGARKKDREGAQIVASKRGSDVTRTKVTKYLLADSYMDPIFQAAQALGDEYRARTLPWTDKGPRILKAEEHLAFEKAIDQREAAFFAAVDYLYDHWEEALDEARRALNGSFNPADYPFKWNLKGLFTVKRLRLPVPSPDAVDDLRLSLGDIEAERIKAQMETDIQAMIDTSLADIMARANKIIGKMATSLREYKPDGPKVEGAFRDTLVSNVVDLVELLPGLNIMNSPEIDGFIQDIRVNLASVEPEELRTDAKLREETAAKAEAILVAMGDFFA